MARAVPQPTRCDGERLATIDCSRHQGWVGRWAACGCSAAARGPARERAASMVKDAGVSIMMVTFRKLPWGPLAAGPSLREAPGPTPGRLDWRACRPLSSGQSAGRLLRAALRGRAHRRPVPHHDLAWCQMRAAHETFTGSLAGRTPLRACRNWAPHCHRERAGASGAKR